MIRPALEWALVAIACPVVLLLLILAGLWFIVFYPLRPRETRGPN
jgi:hypothetical protein